MKCGIKSPRLANEPQFTYLNYQTTKSPFKPVTMISGRLSGRTSAFLRQFASTPRALTPRAVTPRSLNTAATTRTLLAKSKPGPAPSNQPYQLRFFTNATVKNEQEIGAPNASAYIESGVVKQAGNRVDVKKVLVIGSGGLSIGQAGEFDYSGKLCCEGWANRLAFDLSMATSELLKRSEIMGF